MKTWNTGEEILFRYFVDQAERVDNKFHIVSQDSGYKCIFLSPSEFYEEMGTAIGFLEDKPGLHYPLRFLDVGCGVGHKLLLATRMGFDVTGIEIRKEYVEEAEKNLKMFLPSYRHHVIVHDAMTFDKYDKFEIVYFYRPIPNHDLQIKLEQKIASSVKKYTAIIGVLSDSLKDNASLVKIGHSTFVKIK